MAPTADYDGDGIKNGLELYLGKNPLVSDAEGVFNPEFRDGKLSLRFPRANDADPASAKWECSTDLVNWSEEVDFELKEVGSLGENATEFEAFFDVGPARPDGRPRQMFFTLRSLEE